MLVACAALAACASTGDTRTAKAEAISTVAYPQLPDTIVIVPASVSGEGTSGGRIAEAHAVKTTVVAAAETPAPQGLDSNAADAQTVGAVTQPASAQAAVMASADATDQPPAQVVAASYAGPLPDVSTTLADGAQSAINGVAPIAAPQERMGPDDVAARSPELDSLIARYADYYKVPLDLVRRTIKRESTFNPKARNGSYWGLMQISHKTAMGMGYRGTAAGLLDAETNLKYAVRYLRGAFLVARGDHSLADRLYQRGYYYDAKRAGLLEETGLGKDRRRRQSL